MAESLVDVIDAIRELLEPAGPNQATLDDTCAQPFFYGDDVLAVWAEGPDAHRQAGDGRQDEERFTLTAAYTVSDAGERDTKQRHRAISLALDAKAHAYAEIVRANRTGPIVGGQPLWGDINAVINHNVIRTVGENARRGFKVTISGWRIVGP